MRSLLLMSLLALSNIMMAGTAAAGTHAETIAVIGTGRVGGALGPRFAELGYPVIYGSRSPDGEKASELVARSPGSRAALPEDAALDAQIVVLAVPWKGIDATLDRLGPMNGKIIIDITNALQVNADRMMEMSVDTSAGEIIQQRLPAARVVKAFNAMGSHVMADPAAGDGPVTVPLAGNDAAAKERVGALVEQLGFPSLDVGPIRHARHLEGMAVLYMVPYMSGRTDEAFEYLLRTGTAPKRELNVRPAE
jgi:predicted dinucleotide-binding enzyme